MAAVDPFDEMFLALDRGVTVGNMSALTLFDAPAGDGPFTRDALIALVAERLDRMPLLRRRPEPDPSRPGRHVWVDDDAVVLERHIGAHHLEAGDDRELGRLAARLHTSRLDRSRPVWELHVVDGLEGGRVATLLTMHHALGDAAPARHVFETLFAVEGAESATPRIPREDGAPPPAEVDGEPLRAPPTRFNRPLGPERDFAFRAVPSDRIERVRAGSGATANDVLVAAWAGALRGWLALRGETPAQPLLARVPVSLRRDADAAASGNRFAVVPVPIPSDEREGAERLRRASEAMAAAKRTARSVGAHGPAVNLSLSTLPGVPGPLAWAGAPRLGSFSLAPLSGTGLSIACTRYRDQVCLGVHVDADQVPDPWSLLRAFDASLADLETVLAAA